MTRMDVARVTLPDKRATGGTRAMRRVVVKRWGCARIQERKRAGGSRRRVIAERKRKRRWESGARSICGGGTKMTSGETKAVRRARMALTRDEAEEGCEVAIVVGGAVKGG